MAGVLLDAPERKYMPLQEIVDKYDIVEANEHSLVVVERGKTFAVNPNGVDLTELGSTTASNYGSILRQDYNPELRGEAGYRVYDKMRRGDGQVRMSLRMVKTPVLAGRWYMDPASMSKKDQKISEFIWWNLNEGMTASWPQMLLEILNMLDFGWYSFEKVFNVRADGMIYWQKFAPRHPLDLLAWKYDSNGGPNAGEFSSGLSGETVDIPISKLLVFTNDKEGGDMCGMSVLRPAYKHWYYKDNLYKVDAIQKERHGIGIPVIKLPPNFTEKDKDLANELGRNLRTNEKAHVVLPPMWDLIFAKLEGQPVDCLASIKHHDEMIANNILAVFLYGGAGVGGAATDEQQLFLKGARFVAEIVRDVINKWAIPELVNYNWPNVTEYPKLKVRRIGDTVDWRALSFAIRNLVGAQILTPDEKLENWFRDELDLPLADPDTARQPIQKGQTPFNQNGDGKPNQSKQPQVGVGSNKKVGLDGGSPG